jgi:two-component system sensor histidine kinase ResE
MILRFVRSVVFKLWATIIGLVAVVLIILGMFLLQYIDLAFSNNAYNVKLLFVITGVIGFLLTTFFAFFLSFKITQPLLEMKRAADLIAQGDYRMRLPIRSTDEIGELAGTFNHMAAEVDKLIRDLQHEKEHLAGILRSMTDAVITFDARGQTIQSNPPGEAMLKRWSDIAWDGGPEADGRNGGVPGPLRELYAAVLREGRDMSGKVHVQNEVWSVVMAPLNSEQGVRGAVAVLRDVTEEFRLEKLRTDFIANVSHEIRTPLSMLQGYSEALLDDIAASPEEQRDIVRVIHDESVRMGRLVNDLLDLARMESGHFEIKQQMVNIGDLIRRVHRKFHVYTKERNIRLFHALPDKPLILKAADEDRLEQVLTNLLSNAIRHTPEGAAIEMAADEERADGSGWIRIVVRDEGKGISAEDLPYIFERFYKADKARKRGSDPGAGGTGLGLAIVKNIVEAHRGRISAESEVGRGTTFTLLLPVEPARA